MARLYANENFPRPAAETLRRLGHDVLTSLEAGNAGRAVPDAEVLRFAVEDGRALLTLNRRHFIRLHDMTPNHAGIVVCSYDADFAALAERIHSVLTAHSSLAGLLLRINRPA
jgi:hypothetical protein